MQSGDLAAILEEAWSQFKRSFWYFSVVSIFNTYFQWNLEFNHCWDQVEVWAIFKTEIIQSHVSHWYYIEGTLYTWSSLSVFVGKIHFKYIVQSLTEFTFCIVFYTFSSYFESFWEVWLKFISYNHECWPILSTCLCLILIK